MENVASYSAPAFVNKFSCPWGTQTCTSNAAGFTPHALSSVSSFSFGNFMVQKMPCVSTTSVHRFRLIRSGSLSISSTKMPMLNDFPEPRLPVMQITCGLSTSSSTGVVVCVSSPVPTRCLPIWIVPSSPYVFRSFSSRPTMMDGICKNGSGAIKRFSACLRNKKQEEEKKRMREIGRAELHRYAGLSCTTFECPNGFLREERNQFYLVDRHGFEYPLVDGKRLIIDHRVYCVCL